MKRTWKKHRPYAKQILALFLCFVLLSSVILTASAAESADNRTVAAGVFFFDGYHMRGDDGSYSGYGIELLGLISRYSHLNFEFTGYYNTWAETQSMLLNGEIDVATSARKTPERMELFLFSLPLALNNTILSVQEDNTSIISGEYSTYDGMTVGMLAGNSQNQLLPEFAEKNGFTYQVQEYGNTRQMEADLQSGEIDAILTSNLRRTEKESFLDTIQVDYFYAITRKDDQELMDEINHAITQMELYESDWSDILYDKYYATETDLPDSNELTQRELDFIEAVVSGEKRITAAAMPDRRPYSYVEDGEMKGIVPQFFDRLMQMNGLPYELIVPEDTAEYNRLLESGEVDVVMDWHQSAAADSGYTEGGFLTDIYMETGTALVSRMGIGDTASFLAVTEAEKELALAYEQFQDVRIQTYSTEGDVLQAVLDGRADAAFMRTYAAQYFVNNDSTNSLRFDPIDSHQIVFRMYVPSSSDHELANILDKCIQEVPGDALTQLITEYTAITAENLTFRQYMASHPEAIVLLSVLVILGIVMLLFNYQRSRWKNKLLWTTEKSKHDLEQQLAIVSALSRDYTNVYSLNMQTAAFRVVKLDGYQAPGLEPTDKEAYSYADVLRGYIENRVLEEDRDYLTEALSMERVREALAAGAEYTGTYRIKDGDEIHDFQFTYVSYRPEGETAPFALAGFRNIDEIVRNEQKQKDALRDALHMARAASEAKTSFLSSVSHDIRTPMNAIIGFLTLMQDEVENPTAVRKYIRRIDDASKHLLNLINDVLDMSKIESGSTTLSLAEMDLAEVITEINTFIQPQTKAKNQTFEIFTSHMKYEHLVADKMRINQILINLLSNSVKYTPEGGYIEMRVDELPQVVNNYSRIRFTVRDNGLGMSEDYLKVIFEPFTRADTKATHEIQGTGLGMPITKSLVDLMGGTINVESKLGEGTTFYVELELEIREKENEPRFWIDHQINRMLVVDDDEEICRNVVKAMDAVGVATDYTTEGERAVRMVRDAQEAGKSYDLLLLDWKMPEMSGLEAARLIREDSKIPIMLLTAYDWKEIEEEAMEIGVDHFMPKPFFMSTFKEAVHLMMDRTNESKHQESDVVRGMRIMVVDDIEVNRIILVKILGTLGAECDTAANGREAVEKFMATSDQYDLILMDVQMPEMNGYEATRAIRASDHPLANAIPIIAMTANAFVDDVRDAINSGMDAHIAKPVQIGSLKTTIQQVLDNRAATEKL